MEVLGDWNAKGDDFMTLKEIRDMVAHYKVLDVDTIDEVIHELRYLSPDAREVQISSVASLIRNTIEEHPR